MGLIQSRRQKWVSTLESIDLTKSSRRGWNLIMSLNDDPFKLNHANITSNQIAYRLLLNISI